MCEQQHYTLSRLRMLYIYTKYFFNKKKLHYFKPEFSPGQTHQLINLWCIHTKRGTYRSTTSTSSTSLASGSSLTLDRRKPVSQPTNQNNSTQLITFQLTLLFLPWHRWVQMGQEDQWDQSNPEGRKQNGYRL